MSEPMTPQQPRRAARAMTFARCPVCDNMAVVRLPDDWQQQQEQAIPIIACGNPWHYATKSLGDAPEAATPDAGIDAERLADAMYESNIDPFDSVTRTWIGVEEAARFILARLGRDTERREG